MPKVKLVTTVPYDTAAISCTVTLVEVELVDDMHVPKFTTQSPLFDTSETDSGGTESDWVEFDTYIKWEVSAGLPGGGGVA